MDEFPPTIFKQDLGTERGWSLADYARQAAFMASLGADWAQTRTIIKNPERYKELNPLMGEHPSLGKLNNAVALTAIGHAAIANWLSPEARKFFQNVTLGLETANVGRNKYTVGLGATF